MWLANQKHLLLSRRLLLPFTVRRLLRFFPSSAPRRDPEPPPEAAHFMVDYIVNSCGLSRAEAVKASRSLVHLKTPEKPDAVLRLLRQEGLGDAHIRQLVLGHPDVLVSDATKTLQPKIVALRGACFSGSELAQLISSSPDVLKLRNVLPRVEFWRKLVGNNQNLLQAIHSNPKLLTYRLEGSIISNLSLLHGLAVPEDKIRFIVLRKSRVITRSVDSLRDLVELVKSLGGSPGSGLFAAALCSISSLSRPTVDAKSKLLSSFGWTQAEFTSAFGRFPNIFSLSQKRIQKVMDFLLQEAGCEPSYVAHRPALLGYSVEKRLMPRYRVLRSLRMKGLRGGDDDLYNAIVIPEKKFVDKYIIPNSEKYPELLEIYPASSAETTSS